MSAATKPIPAPLTECTDCGKALADVALCFDCGDHGDCVSVESMDDAEREAEGAAASRVRAWAQRQRLLHDLTPDILAHFERCADDLEVHHGA